MSLFSLSEVKNILNILIVSSNIKIKMSVKWIWYIFNELCNYLSQRKKKKIKLTDIWVHKQMTSSIYVLT